MPQPPASEPRVPAVAAQPGQPVPALGASPGDEPGAVPEFQAPPHWQQIDFLSDLHLCAAMPRTFAAFEQHLQNTPADAVFVLGDLFELWVGDEMADQGFEARCTQVLQQASQRMTVAFMVGNRDFLAGPLLMRQAGLTRLDDPTVLQAFGQRVLLSHGDAWCLADTPYQAFRHEVRSTAWQARFLSHTLAERLHIAGAIRSASHERQRFDGALHADVDAAEAQRWMQHAQAPVLVHGHTHRPASQTWKPGATRHVLSDWDLDNGQRAEVLRFSSRGFERLPVTA